MYLGVYATSLSLDIMTSQISVLLKQDNQEKKETTASVQAKKKQEIPFMLDSTNVEDFSRSLSLTIRSLTHSFPIFTLKTSTFPSAVNHCFNWHWP